MNETTPKTLRDGKNITMGYDYMCYWLDAHASTWEATLAHVEKLEQLCNGFRLIIADLERERGLYRKNVDSWAEEIAARDIRIEAAVAALAIEAMLQRIDDVYPNPVLADRLSNIADVLAAKEA